MAASQAPSVPDAPAVHRDLLELRDAVEDVLRRVDSLLERVEDVLDIQESRASLHQGRVPWSDVKADLELS